MEENKVVAEYVVVADRIRRIYAWVSSVAIISLLLIASIIYPCTDWDRDVLECFLLIMIGILSIAIGLIFFLGYIIQKFLIQISIDKKSKLTAIVSGTIGLIIILSTGLLALTLLLTFLFGTL